jgi:hypothetical protein
MAGHPSDEHHGTTELVRRLVVHRLLERRPKNVLAPLHVVANAQIIDARSDVDDPSSTLLDNL